MTFDESGPIRAAKFWANLRWSRVCDVRLLERRFFLLGDSSTDTPRALSEIKFTKQKYSFQQVVTCNWGKLDWIDSRSKMSPFRWPSENQHFKKKNEYWRAFKPYLNHQKTPMRGYSGSKRSMLTCSNDSSHPKFSTTTVYLHKTRARILDEDPQLDGS